MLFETLRVIVQLHFYALLELNLDEGDMYASCIYSKNKRLNLILSFSTLLQLLRISLKKFPVYQTYNIVRPLR
jgi:hypothetical protein